jgi:hypothetical protein
MLTKEFKEVFLLDLSLYQRLHKLKKRPIIGGLYCRSRKSAQRLFESDCKLTFVVLMYVTLLHFGLLRTLNSVTEQGSRKIRNHCNVRVIFRIGLAGSIVINEVMLRQGVHLKTRKRVVARSLGAAKQQS